ncbi:MAG TPA: sugar ABC transporter ATP-binding protein [Capillimicrobium sp.]
MNEPFRLQARAIRKSFGGVEVLHGVDLDATGGTVLALLGENGAGKSTLVKVLAGDHIPDSGEIVVAGETHTGYDPVTARSLGVRMIFQELSDAPALTVAENISLGRWPGKRGLVRWKEVRERALRALDELGVDLDVDRPVAELRIGERQAVEIARAISDRARCLILDEPTAALSSQEVERLFDAVRRLRERGTALIYITHRLDEVVQIADRVEVLRDGNVVLEREVAGTSRAELVTAMVGRAVGEVTRPETVAIDPATPPLLAFEHAGCEGAFADIDLTVRPGEIVALYGKLGSGTAEVGEAAFGLRSLDEGRCTLRGAEHAPPGPLQAIAAGVGLVPADRQREGAFMVRSVAENISVPSWRRLAHRGLLRRGNEARAYRRWHDELSIRSRNEPEQLIGTLSGGNQQKVVLGRWLERESDVLVLIEPTRGVDVGARMEIYREIRKLASGGMGVLVATSDYEEVVQLADRAAVMARGRIVGELDGEAITTERLTELAGG